MLSESSARDARNRPSAAALLLTAVVGLVFAAAPDARPCIPAGSAPLVAASATFTSAAPVSPGTNPLSRVLYSMNGPHEAPLAGVPASYAWGSHPVIGSVQPPAGWDSATAWGLVYADANAASSEPAQGSVRVELRDMQLYIWSDSQSAWLQVQGSTQVTGGQYVDDFAGNASIPADWAIEADGGSSSALVAGYALHFWPSGDRTVLPVPASDIGAVYATVQARLIGPAAASARYVLGVGGDWWQTPTAGYPDNTGIGTGRFMYLSASWGSFDFWTGGAYGAGPPAWTGAKLAAHPPESLDVALAAPRTGGGVWAAQDDGAVRPGDGTTGFGGPSGLVAPVIGIAATPDGGGYWVATADGGVFSLGDAIFKGSAGGVHLAQPIVGMAATPDGAGYWLVARDGGIFSFGDARFFGSTGAIRLNEPIVGMAATPDGGGYWLVAADGGTFSFGDARFMGSAGGVHLAQPIVGMAATPDGGGYWLVAADGGVFTYGDAAYEGSGSDSGLGAPVTAMAVTPDGNGYWLLGADGEVLNFGDAPALSP